MDNLMCIELQINMAKAMQKLSQEYENWSMRDKNTPKQSLNQHKMKLETLHLKHSDLQNQRNQMPKHS